MKNALTALASLAIVAGLASCHKPSNDTPVTGNVTLTFEMADTGRDTKVTYTEVGNNLRPAWEVGDVIVGQAKDGSANFTLTVKSVSGGSATVTGNAPLDADVCLLYLNGVSTIGSLPISVDYSNQSGNKNMPAVMLSKGHIDKDGKGNFTFSGAGAVIGIDNAKGVPAGSVVTKVTISGDNLSGGSLTKSGDAFVLAATSKTGDSISTGTLGGITVGNGDDRKLSSPVLIAVPAGVTSAKVAKVTLTTNNGDYYYKLSSAKDAEVNKYFYVKDRTFVCPPDGALPGQFSVSPTRKVYFSKGNLQATYNGTGFDWNFAPNQYSYVGEAPGNTRISALQTGDVVDLFGWSTITNNYGITASEAPSDYSGDFVDWGKAYCQSKGITALTTWRTLTGLTDLSDLKSGEWNYLFFVREVPGVGVSFTKGKISIEGKTYFGIYIYPDDYVGVEMGKTGAPDTWQKINDAGIAFLPVAGGRMGDRVNYVDSHGYYWSSTDFDAEQAFCLGFNNGGAGGVNKVARGYGACVRLVSDCK